MRSARWGYALAGAGGAIALGPILSAELGIVAAAAAGLALVLAGAALARSDT